MYQGELEGDLLRHLWLTAASVEVLSKKAISVQTDGRALESRRQLGLLRRVKPKCGLPFHLESHRCQTVQAADWIAALAGRPGVFRAEPEAWPENAVFSWYFEDRLADLLVRSGNRS